MGYNSDNTHTTPFHQDQTQPTVQSARLKCRHFGIFLSFILGVIAPVFTVGYYLYTYASDQYVSKLAFTVRSEDSTPIGDALLGLPGLSSASSKDTDILYNFIHSQQMIEEVSAKIDLAALYSKPADDPVFAYDPNGSIEDLLKYWSRMVQVSYDASTGLIELEVNAFSARDAQRIATEIYNASLDLINRLTAISHNDRMDYAKIGLDKAETELKAARRALTEFRKTTKIVDPTADIAGQMGLLTSLQTQLAQALIEKDLLISITQDDDPRLKQINLKIDVTKNRITEERKKFGLDGEAAAETLSSLIDQYEALNVDLEFSQDSYIAMRTAYDAEQAEAIRQSRYLATYINPTLAEKPLRPKRLQILCLTGGFAFLAWTILLLIFYSVRDRR